MAIYSDGHAAIEFKQRLVFQGLASFALSETGLNCLPKNAKQGECGKLIGKLFAFVEDATVLIRRVFWSYGELIGTCLWCQSTPSAYCRTIWDELRRGNNSPNEPITWISGEVFAFRESNH